MPPTSTIQNRLSKRRRLDPDPVFPTLRPVPTLRPEHASPGPMTSRVQPHLPPAANSLEGLPVELQLMVFNFLPDVATLDALVHASPVHHRLFAYPPLKHTISRVTVLTHVVQYKVYNSMLAIEAYISTRKPEKFEKVGSPSVSSANVKYCEGYCFYWYLTENRVKKMRYQIQCFDRFEDRENCIRTHQRRWLGLRAKFPRLHMD